MPQLKVKALNFRRQKPQQPQNPQTQEKVTCLTLQIRKDRKKHYYIKDIDLKKLQALDNYHRKNTQAPNWKLSENGTKLLLT